MHKAEVDDEHANKREKRMNGGRSGRKLKIKRRPRGEKEE